MWRLYLVSFAEPPCFVCYSTSSKLITSIQLSNSVAGAWSRSQRPWAAPELYRSDKWCYRVYRRSVACRAVWRLPRIAGIEKSLYIKQPRTTVYYAHPYNAWERGSNEAANCMICRFVPKGTDIGRLSNRDVKRIERWMNDYPRRKLGYLFAYKASSFGKLFSVGCDN